MVQFCEVILIILAVRISQGEENASETWSGDNHTNVLRLEDILPHHVTYDKSKPPTFQQHPAVVFLHITVLMLDSFDQNEMTFTTGKEDF